VAVGCLATAAPGRAQEVASPDERTQPPPIHCSAEDLMSAVANLFPPADPDRRAASARALARCRDPRTVGALRAALVHDRQPEVQVESLRALAAVGDRAPVQAILEEARAPDPLRVAALEALGAAGEAPSAEELAALESGAGPALTAAIEMLRTQRSAAAAAALEPGAGVPTLGTPGGSDTRPTRPGEPVVVIRPPARARRPIEIIRTPPPPPPKPWIERDGTALAITTSIAAGGLWGSGLSLLAQQNGVGVVTLLGSAGAVIGGGTAWGLTRFGLRPDAAQALWFANSTAWGTLAGLTIWSGSNSDSLKLKYGLLVGGETVGILAGAWSARRFGFRPSETLFADSLVLGTGLGLVGASMLWDPDSPWNVPPAAAIGVVPTMVGAAVATKLATISALDVPLLVLSPLAGGWTGALLASGAFQTPLLSTPRGLGGATLGLSAGYLGAAAAASFIDVPARRLMLTSSGLLVGNALGLGVHMLADHDRSGRWPLGAGLGGLALATAAYASAPHLHPGPSAASMTVAGALYGSGVWTLALTAGSTGQPPDARVPGGMLAGSVALGLGGLVASQWFQPQAYHQSVAALGTLAGMGAGLGTAKLITDEKGLPDLVGVIGGAVAGFTGGAVLSTGARLRPPALLAGVEGAGYGLLVGTLLPTLPDRKWSAGRKTAGAAWLGTSLGAAGATLAARALDADGGQVALVGGAGVLGLGIGAGTGWLWPSSDSRGARIGLLTGSTGMLAVGIAAERTLQLSDSLDLNAVPLALFGAAVGSAHGYLVGRVIEPDEGSPFASRQKGGAVLMGASAGIATGVLAAKWARPTGNDYLGMAGASVLGHSAGLGIAKLALDSDGRGEPLLRLTGALAGLSAGALVARTTELRAPDLLAGLSGAAYGAILGNLAPSLHRGYHLEGDRATGGAHLGLAIGGAAGATAAHLTGASSSDVLVPTVFAGVGGLAGLGFGQLLPEDGNQRGRVASAIGMLTFAGGSIALDRPLRLSEGFRPPGSGTLSLLGLAVGAIEGDLLARFIHHAPLDAVNTRGSGLLLGQVVGATSGFVLSRFIQPTLWDDAVAVGGGVVGGTLGVGLSMLATDEPGRAEIGSMFAGSLLGLGGLALTQHYSPLEGADFLALPIGASFGGMFGRLLPTLDDTRIGPLDRTATGGLVVGLTGGTVAAMATRHLTDARPGTVALTGLGGVDGLLTGLGVGLLIDGPVGESRAQRIGAVAGAAAGLGIGAGLWPRLQVRGADAAMIASLLGLGAWNGLLAPGLGHADLGTVSERHTAGGVLVGAGASSLLATALVPALDLDRDLIGNALALDVLLTGAGAGTGALISQRHDASVWGALAGGTTGLVLGAALHRSIELDDRRIPLLRLTILEGLWLGGWLPFTLRDREQVTSRQLIGGLAAGGLGGAALATLAGSAFQPDGQATATAALTSAIGASLAGGSALIAGSLPSRARVGLLLGGTGAGLLVGSLGARSVDLGAGAGYAAVGTMLGASEGLVFAWSGRADGGADYAGAALVGAGAGSTMGLVAASNPQWMEGRALPAAGFAGWGAWMGSFAGALINRDPHEVTLGGLAGANAGALAGLGLLASGTVEPRDFGWLSAFGAAGTVLGGGVGALFSTRTDPRPALAGLLVGPAVGLTTGALVLPKLRTLGSTARADTPPPARADAPRPAAAPATETSERTRTSADLWEGSRPRSLVGNIRRSFGVSRLMPVLGAMPASDPAAGPPPFVLGLAGLWH
jgi:hypothetical protein